MQAGVVRYVPAEVGDIDGLAALHAAAVTVGYRHIFPVDADIPTIASLRPGWIELVEDPEAQILVARDNDLIVGSVALLSDASVPRGLLIKRLHVLPTHWGNGIGATLHDRALDLATERGATALNLWVLEANDRARGMYERRNWTLHEPRRTFANQPANIVDVLYQIDLS